MPYSELHMAKGKHDLKYNLQIQAQGRWNALDSSDWVRFRYTKN